MADSIGIVGAGRMGSAIAQMFAHGGFNVVLVDVSLKFLMNAINLMNDNLDKEVSEGKLTPSQKKDILSHLKTGTDFALLKSCSLCLEIVIENEGIKSYIHKKIREKAGSSIIIASNSATLPIEPMAKHLGKDGKFVGLTFGFPPQTAADVKIIPAPHTEQVVIEHVSKTLRAIGKTPQLVGDRKKDLRVPLETRIWLFLIAMILSFGMLEIPSWCHLASSTISLFEIFGLGFGLLSVLYFSHELITRFKHIDALLQAMTGLAANDLAVDVPLLTHKDECGDMARTIDIFKKITIEVARLSDEEAKKMKTDVEKRKRLESLTSEFEQNVGKIVQGVAAEALQLQGNAKHLAEMSDQTSRQAATVAAATEEASASVQTVASAAEELSASISEIDRQVEESSRVTKNAVEEVKHTDTTVSTLSEAAAQIGDVVKLIQDIAEQTNLLALNATIEAARAGEAGKGFAVVASEVKNLANQTARATEEISSKIVTVQNVSGEAVAAIRGIGSTIEKISEISNVIADTMRQQAEATKEISNNVQQASAGTSEVSNSIINVTHAASESNTAANEVLKASEDLSKQSDLLRTEVQVFLNKVTQR